MIIEPTLHNWLVDFAQAANDHGLCRLPLDFPSLVPRRQSEAAALLVCEVKRAADRGEAGATAFFRTHQHWLQPPSVPEQPKVRDKIRVGFLTPSMTFPGGAERWIQMLCGHEDGRIEWSGVCITGKHRDWESVESLERFCPVMVGVRAAPVMARECDVLMVWGVDEPRYLVPEFEGKILVTSHGCGHWTEHCLKTTPRWADKCVAVSQAAAASFPEGAGHVDIIWNGVYAGDVKPKMGRDYFRDEMGIAPSDKVVGFIGRYSWEKNPTAAARAVQHLGGDWKALYIADGWQRPEICQAIRRICPDRAIIGPRVSHVGDALAAIDVFLLASPAEGMSLGLIEAWMAGTPTAATRVGAIPELEKEFGQLVVPIKTRPGRRELADACVEAISRENMPIVDNAHQAANTRLSGGAMCQQYCEQIVDLARCLP